MQDHDAVRREQHAAANRCGEHGSAPARPAPHLVRHGNLRVGEATVVAENHHHVAQGAIGRHGLLRALGEQAAQHLVDRWRALQQ